MSKASYPMIVSVVAVLTTGCQSAKFVRTDDAFVETRKPTPPEIFVDARPSRSFRTVGVLEVAAAAETPEADVASDLTSRAQDVGCDVLVSRRLLGAEASKGRLPFSGQIQLVHEGHNEPPVVRDPPTPRTERERPQTGPSSDSAQTERGGRTAVDKGGALKKFEFVCGVYEAAASMAPTML